MEQPKQDRWRRPGMRLATLALLVLAVYFLAIFIQQSIRVYQLNQERRQQEQLVSQLRQENEELRRLISDTLEPDVLALLAKSNLPVAESGERVVRTYEPAGSAAGAPPVAGQAGPDLAAITALPPWQQWWRMIFYPAVP